MALVVYLTGGLIVLCLLFLMLWWQDNYYERQEKKRLREKAKRRQQQNPVPKEIVNPEDKIWWEANVTNLLKKQPKEQDR